MPEVEIHAEPYVVTTADLRTLLQPGEGPRVSIYCATAPSANADQGRIRFKSAVQKVESALNRSKQPGQEEHLLEPLRQLADHSTFWLSQTRGLAVFLSRDQFRVLNLVADVDDVTVVDDSFHVKPLIRILQPGARYQVLCVSTDRVALYEGDRQRLHEVPLHPDVPKNMGEALGEPSRVTNPKDGVFVPDDSDTRDRQLQRYFRRLDDAIWEHHSRDAAVPLILAALPEYHGFFHQASRNSLLVDVGIRRDPFKEVDAEKLRKLAWEAVEPVWLKRLADMRERYGTAAAHDRGTSEIEEAARQAVFGKVDTLLLKQGQRVGGSIDPGTGKVTFEDMKSTQTDDVLDDLAEVVLRNGGEVLIVPEDQMPDGTAETGIAAIMRF